MSKDIPHAECQRRERELEALITGLSKEVSRLGDELDSTEALLIRAKNNMTENGGYAELKADEALRLALEQIEEARRYIRKHKRRKAFTTGLGLSGFDE